MLEDGQLEDGQCVIHFLILRKIVQTTYHMLTYVKVVKRLLEI